MNEEVPKIENKKVLDVSHFDRDITDCENKIQEINEKLRKLNEEKAGVEERLERAQKWKSGAEKAYNDDPREPL